MLPSLFTLGRLIILRVASLREERPELLRGAWGGAAGPAWSGASTKFILIRRRGR